MFHESSSILSHQLKRDVRVWLALLLVPLLLLSFGLSAAPVRGETEIDFTDWEDTVRDHQNEVSLSKDYVFEGEIFRAQAVVVATLNEDLDFKNVVDIEYEVTGQRRGGGTVTLGRYTGSVGPLANLKAATRLRYALLDSPMAFPATAPAGLYDLELEIIKIEPENIWNTVQENTDEDLVIELESIQYFGIPRPEIGVSVSSPYLVEAGDVFSVGIGVTSPPDIKVNLALSLQTSGEAPQLIKLWSVTGDSLVSEIISAPFSGGELTLIAEATSIEVQGTEVILERSVAALASTMVEMTPPSLSIDVDNPAVVDEDVNFEMVARNPFPYAISMGVYLRPEWEVPEWAGEDVAWFFSDMVIIEVEALGETRVSLSVAPITEQGRTYSLKALSTHYELGGTSIEASPRIEAEALVTTATEPTGLLEVSPASVYPSEAFTVEPTIINPGASDITLDYLVKVYSSEMSENIFGTSFTSWVDGTVNLGGGEAVTIPGLEYVTGNDSARRYLGFELMVEGTSLSRVIRYVKSVTPPEIKVIPSHLKADLGEQLTLEIQLNNPMSVAVDFTVEVQQRVWNGTVWVETALDEDDVSLSAYGQAEVKVSARAPGEPVIVEYGARISELTVAGADYVVEASSWVRVQIEELVLPQVSLILNPNPVQTDSSLEIRTTLFNPSGRTMTIPYSIYLKPPSSFPFLWKEAEATLAAGESVSVSEYLDVESDWQSFGNMKVTIRIEELLSNKGSIPLAPPVEVSKSFGIMDLQLRASLKTKVVDFDLSYDRVSNSLVMDKVYLESTIVVTNLGGWESSPDIALTLTVPTSEGVQLVENWEAVSEDVHDLVEGEFIISARIAIVNPTAANLADVRFVARVTGEGVSENLTLGMFRIADGSWRLDEDGRLVTRASGSAFASSVWDSDEDGFSDYAEMMDKGTDPLDATDPGAISADEREERIQGLEAQVNAFAFRAQGFIDTANSGGTLLPNGHKAWERIEAEGRSAEESLEMLKDLTGKTYSSLSAKIAGLVSQIDSLEAIVNDRYGESSVPSEVSDMALEAMMGMSSEESTGDPDGDGLPTAVELGLGFDPQVWDSQQAGISDRDYLEDSLAAGMSSEDQELAGSYMVMGQTQEIIAAMKAALPEDWAMTEADELALIEEAQRQLKNATWEYINAFFR